MTKMIELLKEAYDARTLDGVDTYLAYAKQRWNKLKDLPTPDEQNKANIEQYFNELVANDAAMTAQMRNLLEEEINRLIGGAARLFKVVLVEGVNDALHRIEMIQALPGQKQNTIKITFPSIATSKETLNFTATAIFDQIGVNVRKAPGYSAFRNRLNKLNRRESRIWEDRAMTTTVSQLEQKIKDSVKVFEGEVSKWKKAVLESNEAIDPEETSKVENFKRKFESIKSSIIDTTVSVDERRTELESLMERYKIFVEITPAELVKPTTPIYWDSPEQIEGNYFIVSFLKELTEIVNQVEKGIKFNKDFGFQNIEGLIDELVKMKVVKSFRSPYTAFMVAAFGIDPQFDFENPLVDREQLMDRLMLLASALNYLADEDNQNLFKFHNTTTIFDLAGNLSERPHFDDDRYADKLAIEFLGNIFRAMQTQPEIGLVFYNNPDAAMTTKEVLLKTEILDGNKRTMVYFNDPDVKDFRYDDGIVASLRKYLDANGQAKAVIVHENDFLRVSPDPLEANLYRANLSLSTVVNQWLDEEQAKDAAMTTIVDLNDLVNQRLALVKTTSTKPPLVGVPWIARLPGSPIINGIKVNFTERTREDRQRIGWDERMGFMLRKTKPFTLESGAVLAINYVISPDNFNRDQLMRDIATKATTQILGSGVMAKVTNVLTFSEEEVVDAPKQNSGIKIIFEVLLKKTLSAKATQRKYDIRLNQEQQGPWYVVFQSGDEGSTEHYIMLYKLTQHWSNLMGRIKIQATYEQAKRLADKIQHIDQNKEAKDILISIRQELIKLAADAAMSAPTGGIDFKASNIPLRILSNEQVSVQALESVQVNDLVGIEPILYNIAPWTPRVGSYN